MTARRVRAVVCLVAAAFLLAACNDAAPPTIQGAQQVKLLVDADGLYRISGPALQSAVADLSSVDLASIRLERNQVDVPIRLTGTGERLAIDFYATDTAVADAPEAAYMLRWGGQAGRRMAEVEAQPTSAPAAAPQAAYTATVRYSHPALYVPQAGENLDHWFWQALPAPITNSLSITLVNALPGDALLTLRLWGSTQDAVQPNHHLRLEFDSQAVSDESWAGQGEHVITATLPAKVVTSGAHNLRLIAPGDTGAVADVTLLKEVSVEYRRRLLAESGLVEFIGAGEYQADGFGAGAITLFDVSNASNPQIIKNATAANGKLTVSAPDGETRHWIAAADSGYRTPRRITAVPADSLRQSDQQADYIIVTHPDFMAALAPLIALRQKAGLHVTAVSTESIFNAFGGGEESARAIRDFLSYAYANWQKPAPRYVLLVGKASYDIHDYLKGPNKNLVPTMLLPTLNLGETGADNALVSFDEAMLKPSLAIGRLPVKTAAQLSTVIDKIVAYEANAAQGADWRSRALVVADDKDPDFELLADDLIGRLPPGMHTTRAYLKANGGAVAPTKQTIVDAWNQGTALVSYVGHGSISLWAQGPLFTAADGNKLQNGERLPFLLTPTCLDGYFLDAQQDSLAEQLLFKKDGGIIAGLVPTGLSFPPNQRKLTEAFADALFGPEKLTVGAAMLGAKQAMTVEGPSDAEVVQTFTLLGDPALRLAIGN